MAISDFGFEGRLRRPRRVRGSASNRHTTAYLRLRFAIVAALLDLNAVTGTALAVGVIYHAFFYQIGGMAEASTGFGLAMASLFVTLNAFRDQYAITNYLTFRGHARRVWLVWNITFLTALVFMFAAKQTAVVSRASALLFYVDGLLALLATRAILVLLTKRRAANGRVALLRVVLVGGEAELRHFVAHYKPWTVGIDVVASTVLRGAETLTDDLALAAATARVLHPDDVFILAPWSDDGTIDAMVAAFMNVPAAIHLGPQQVLDRFTKAKVSRIGPIASLHIVRHPLTTAEQLVKRVFDVVLAAILLVLLAPFFLLVALAIKIDSRGPVFFIQRRYGFNQHTFRMVKFRSMSVAEDDRRLTQAVRDDPRVTRAGRVLRRLNIDELPQLINVLRGEMSLVGPRPHALVHNQHYERTIADYARRHNVKPGITGWAQVHGLRGETASDAIMRARLQHDLFYIDNWSFTLDVRILGLTLLSAQAFANAY